DRDEDGLPQYAVARRQSRVELVTRDAPVDELREEPGAGDHDCRDADSFPEVGHCSLFAPVDGFPPGVPLFEAVPERDRVFADVPTEQHLMAFALRWKVEQPEVEVLDHPPELLEPVDAGEGGVAETAELGLRRVQVTRGITAPVPADRHHEVALRV